ncbi:polysaccharide biosynthesis protein [Thermodesulfobacterium geofontis OPF15]|uniref:Polysaccharide biosynthesis protein n=1 Tax=Thermodesulfobacterium geofontis (strain OPF15) TaxID=795359 RepID=F8C3J5_THEGP|nr:flippase [Thermodesulfobacterium geofontis]AEH22444.1 polysaccharide biosynthesis protein [Thermodesulfobacterium geofontis OPF15]
MNKIDTNILAPLKNLLATETRRRLFENFLSLSFLQVANYIFPLITLPYLVRVLGPEKFGLISFAQAFIGYFVILTDYGFNLSATREIAIYREDKEKVSEIFSSVMVIKFFLFFLSLGIMSAIIFTFEKFRQDWEIYYLTFGMVLGQVLFPVWFFQGMERMKYITFLNILAKLIFTIAIFAFVRKVEDYLYVPLLNSLGFIVAGVLGLWIVFKDFGIGFRMPSWEGIKHQLKEGWYIFISTVAISLYTISNTFILGLFTNNTIVGYYSAAEKIIKAIQGLLGPISQTIYPHVSKLMYESKECGIKFLRKVTLLIGSFSFVLSLIIFIFADLIVRIVLGSQYTESVIVLRILAFLPFIIGLSNIFAVQGLIAYGKLEIIPKITLAGAISNIFIALLLVNLLQAVGVAISVLIAEAVVTFISFYYFKRVIIDRRVIS